jgi:hypothetical protein
MTKPVPQGGNLSRQTKQNVKSNHLGLNPGPKVVSRITLNSGGIDTTCMLYESQLDNARVVFPSIVEWKVDNVADSVLHLVFHKLNGNSADTMGLTARSVNDTIQLYFRHVPVRGANGPPRPRERATHMGAIYEMLDVPSRIKRPIPRYIGKAPNDNSGSRACLWPGNNLNPLFPRQFKYDMPGTFGCMVSYGFTP